MSVVFFSFWMNFWNLWGCSLKKEPLCVWVRKIILLISGSWRFQGSICKEWFTVVLAQLWTAFTVYIKLIFFPVSDEVYISTQRFVLILPKFSFCCLRTYRNRTGTFAISNIAVKVCRKKVCVLVHSCHYSVTSIRT